MTPALNAVDRAFENTGDAVADFTDQFIKNVTEQVEATVAASDAQQQYLEILGFTVTPDRRHANNALAKLRDMTASRTTPRTPTRGGGGGGGRAKTETEELLEEEITATDLVRRSIERMRYLGEDTYRETRDGLRGLLQSGEIDRIEYWKGVERLDKAYERSGKFFTREVTRSQDMTTEAVKTGLKKVSDSVCCGRSGTGSSAEMPDPVDLGLEHGPTSQNTRDVLRIDPDGTVHYVSRSGGGVGQRPLERYLRRSGGQGRDEIATYFGRNIDRYGESGAQVFVNIEAETITTPDLEEQILKTVSEGLKSNVLHAPVPVVPS